MSKLLRVNDGDYTVQVREGGIITLDTGEQLGEVIITGNLTVYGNQTIVDSEDLQVKDNIIYINVGETGNGITLGSAGLEIERGTATNVTFLYDESTDTFVFRQTDPAQTLVGITTKRIVTTGNSDLEFDTGTQNGTPGVLTVRMVDDYEQQVLNYSLPGLPPRDSDIIPNIKAVVDYVNAYVGTTSTNRITEGDTIVEVHDLSENDGPSRVTFTVDGVEKGQFNASGFVAGNISLNTNTIGTSSGGLTLDPTTSEVILDGYLTVNNTTAPTASAGNVKIYSKSTVGVGGTGLNVVNTKTNDELVSRRKALAFGMIF